MASRAHLYFTQPEAEAAFDDAMTRGGVGRLERFEDAITRVDGRGDRLVLRCAGDACPRHVLTEFVRARASTDRPIALGSVVTTLDARATWQAFTGASPGRIPAVTTAAQIEHATTVVLTDWRRLDVDDIQLLVALLGHLNPSATLVLLGAGSRLGVDDHPADLTDAVLGNAGWMRVVSGTFTPRGVHERVTTFRYENLRPFHPGRLAAWFDGSTADETGRVVRSAGFCRLATRPRDVALWDHCGPELTFSPLGGQSADAEPLAFGQDIAFVGIDLDVARLTATLDACTLDDDELLAGADRWARMRDPLPQWDA